MQRSDFHFDLPQHLIASFPLTKRSASRLLCVEKGPTSMMHRHFHDIVDLIMPGDLLVFNDTKVIPARLKGNKSTGGKVELLVERILDDKRILAQLHVSKAPKVGDQLFFADQIQFAVIARRAQFFELKFEGVGNVLEVIEAIGEIPLPPYMGRQPCEADKERYQTIYAHVKGSVAAPTAGLHFDTAILQHLREKQVQLGTLTLHIGAGTFLPVRVENIVDHKMHSEFLTVSAALCQQIKATKARGKRVIAVGTTSMRALETVAAMPDFEGYCGDTAIFIYPGYQFRCVDALITNLHLPCSSLLMLVCAFGGYEPIMQAYREAVANNYRFYSYGDAMWVTKLAGFDAG